MRLAEVQVLELHQPGVGMVDACQALIDHNDDPKACSFVFKSGFDREQWATDAAFQIGVAYDSREAGVLAKENIMPGILEAIDKYLEDK